MLRFSAILMCYFTYLTSCDSRNPECLKTFLYPTKKMRDYRKSQLLKQGLRCIGYNSRRDKYQKLTFFVHLAVRSEQYTHVRDIAKQRHFTDVIEYLLLINTTQNNGFTIFNQHLGANLLGVN